MSMVLTRSPLEPIGMNGAGTQKRRSARLSQEGNGENEPPTKKTKVQGTTTTTVTTKQDDGEAKPGSKKSRKVYEQQVDGFEFSKGKRKASMKQPAVRNSLSEKPAAQAPPPEPPAAPREEVNPKPTQKKSRRKLPTTPEREEKVVRRSKRISDENAAQTSPQRPAHAKSHANTERSPSPEQVQPVTIEKKRKQGANGIEEEKVKRFVLNFADTPVIDRNKQMRKSSAEGHRRSSTGMRGRRASSLMGEGRGNALPHAEVPASEFFKHISADMPEPRRMRCLLGWCGARALPAKLSPPEDNSSAATLETQALQAARVIQEELSQDLTSKGILSDWFSRDESVPPQVPLRKKPNPRNITNAAKVQELEKELERLKAERTEWDGLIKSAAAPASSREDQEEGSGPLSPIRSDLLENPQRALFEQLQTPAGDDITDPNAIQTRLSNISEDLEYTVDRFAHGVHALSTAREVAERVADRALADAANLLEEREKQQTSSGKAVDQMDALKGLARVLNAQYKRP